MKVYYQSGKNMFELIQIEKERANFLKSQSSSNMFSVAGLQNSTPTVSLHFFGTTPTNKLTPATKIDTDREPVKHKQL